MRASSPSRPGGKSHRPRPPALRRRSEGSPHKHAQPQSSGRQGRHQQVPLGPMLRGPRRTEILVLAVQPGVRPAARSDR
eukprot:428252-Alexandrium_andersonii.AAC.1